MPLLEINLRAKPALQPPITKYPAPIQPAETPISLTLELGKTYVDKLGMKWVMDKLSSVSPDTKIHGKIQNDGTGQAGLWFNKNGNGWVSHKSYIVREFISDIHSEWLNGAELEYQMLPTHQFYNSNLFDVWYSLGLAKWYKTIYTNPDTYNKMVESIFLNPDLTLRKKQ